jgi:hemoglobin
LEKGNMNGIVKWIVPLVAVVSLAAGCGNPEQKDRDFHTSGSREADQRAEQQVAKVQQLRGEGSGDDEKKPKDTKKNKEGVKVKSSLFERLDGQRGIALIVEDWINRAVADPRVNWARKGVKRGGFGFNRGDSVEWANTPDNGTRLKQHIGQFITLSTGGPPTYDGKEMKAAHADLQITNDEFDAAIGDLKASLDNLGIPTEEQKELLAIIESTRPQVVKKR